MQPNHPITLDQKRALVAAYRVNGGNMSRAMRAAGIASRQTAYRWWRRVEADGEAALEPRSHARTHSGRIAVRYAARICQLKREHPRWGRRRIAQALAGEAEGIVVSPSGVEAVLRRSALWPRRHSPMAETPARRDLSVLARKPLDREALFVAIRQGLEASVTSRARDAVRLLWRGTWLPLWGHTTECQRLLSDLNAGPWILRSWIQLGHSFMNVGDWIHAQQVFHQVMTWLEEHEPPLGQREHDGSALSFSLHWNDLWFECFQYLGIVWRESNDRLAARYLSTARSRMELSNRRGRPPTNYQGHLANIERDAGKLQLHRLRHGQRVPLSEIAEHVRASQRAQAADPDPGMCAATEILRAQLQSLVASVNQNEDRSARRAALDEMQEAVAQSLELVRGIESPMLKAMFTIDAAELYERHALPANAVPLLDAAQFCSTFGYGRQARKLLRLKASDRVVPADVRELLRRQFGQDGT